MQVALPGQMTELLALLAAALLSAAFGAAAPAAVQRGVLVLLMLAVTEVVLAVLNWQVLQRQVLQKSFAWWEALHFARGFPAFPLVALVVKLTWAVVPLEFGGQGGQRAVLFSLAFVEVLAALAALKVAVAEVPAPGMVSCWSAKSNLLFQSLPQSSPR
jgi:hypothetical protein